ncbi:unnamed protein product [Linum trigynum]|uniref:Uncharacterized protein n=1 Tax=Linum trigynum TaxID=586398 RepID=A0AAV2GHH1_9ROSI
MNLVHKLRSSEIVQDEVGVICRSIRRYMQELGNNTWHPINREANALALLVTHAEVCWDERMIWVDNPPSFLKDQMQLDIVTMVSD